MKGANVLTLSELQRAIKSTLAERFALGVWVSAEIADLKVNYSGHCYLELVEKGEGGALSKAQSRAVIWRSNYTALSSYFASQTGQNLAAGLKVLVKVLVNFHEVYGLSLQITDIDPTYTLGEVERQRQMTIAQLKKDGVWDMNREQPLPQLIQRLAIISSANAAGYQDFCQEIGSSPYYFYTTLFDAYMQGEGAEESIIGALEAIALSEEEFDAVVLVRGGGSSSDLRCFDTYRLSSHVAQFPIAIISGIGHDKDVSVVDMVTAISLKTPTAVASFLVERMAQIEGWLESAALMLHDSATQITRSFELYLGNLTTELNSRSEHLIASQQSLLEGYTTSLPQVVDTFLCAERNHLEGLSTSVAFHSPDHLLRLGYAVARVGGAALRSSKEIKCGEEITLELLDSIIVTEVKSIEKKR